MEFITKKFQERIKVRKGGTPDEVPVRSAAPQLSADELAILEKLIRRNAVNGVVERQ